MMKQMMKRLSALVLSMLLVIGLSATAFAAESSVTFQGKKKGFGFGPGTDYHTTDLFNGFKNVMPGDELTETVTIKNSAKDCDYIKLYLRAEPHDAEDNTPEYNRDTAKAEGKKNESVATMDEFLSQLTMTIYNGDKVIYQSSPDKTGKLTENVYLGQLKRNKSVELKVVLDVPEDLGNAYANRVGEVDWVFHADCYTEDSLIQTGQLNWPIPVLCGLGILLIAVGLFVILRKRRENRA